MSEKIRRVAVDGPPDPDQWVCYRVPGEPGWWSEPRLAGGLLWNRDVEWYPVPAPPTEYLTVDDEGVEVDGKRLRIEGDYVLVDYLTSGRRDYLRHGDTRVPVNVLRMLGAYAQALGLVDRPNVPKALVEWLRGQEAAGRLSNGYDSGWAEAMGVVAGCIEAGEFGPVEPSDGPQGLQSITDDDAPDVYPYVPGRPSVEAAGLGERGEAT